VTEGGRVPAVAAALIGCALCVALGAWPLALVAGAAVLTLVPVARAWLGGVTGDVLGAAAELTELAALVTAVALT
jgi:adenosylcobinamide-GDP ribazoletransferase